jgi:hypothetical protein
MADAASNQFPKSHIRSLTVRNLSVNPEECKKPTYRRGNSRLEKIEIKDVRGKNICDVWVKWDREKERWIPIAMDAMAGRKYYDLVTDKKLQYKDD